MTTVRGFKLNDCKKCGSKADVEDCGFFYRVGCSREGNCLSPQFVNKYLAVAGRAWNRVN